MSPLAVMLAKEMVNAAYETSSSQGVAASSAACSTPSSPSADQKEGMAAFIEKRPGAFAGR